MARLPPSPSSCDHSSVVDLNHYIQFSMRWVLGLDPSSTSEADRSLLDRNLSYFMLLLSFSILFSPVVRSSCSARTRHHSGPPTACFAAFDRTLQPRAIPLHSRVGNRRSIARSTGLPPGFTLTVGRMDGRLPRGPRGAIIWRRLSPAYLFIYLFNSMPSPASNQQCRAAPVQT